MRIHRFYSPIPLAEGQLYQLPKETAHHCIQVLRYNPGDSLILFNGDGFEYLAVIKNINGKNCEVLISQQSDPENESPLKIHLYQGIARGEKMDWIIQKSVELGVSEITPLFSEHCNVKLDGKRLKKKQVHWQNIAISACEQSARAKVPKINMAVNLNKLGISKTEKNKSKAEENKAQVKNSCAHLCLEPGSTKKLQSLSTIKEAVIYIGPVGGFSPSDLQHLVLRGVERINLGPRILRTETAGIAAIAILQSHFGDL